MSVAEMRPAAAPSEQKFRAPRTLVARARALALKLARTCGAGGARPQYSAGIGGRVHRRRAHSHAATEALGRLRARPRSRVRHRGRARPIDLRLLGLVPELPRRSRLHAGAVSRRGAARRLEPQQGGLHRHLGGADRKGDGGVRRLPARRPLVVVLGLAPFALDHDRWAACSATARTIPTCGFIWCRSRR